MFGFFGKFKGNCKGKKIKRKNRRKKRRRIKVNKLFLYITSNDFAHSNY